MLGFTQVFTVFYAIFINRARHRNARNVWLTYFFLLDENVRLGCHIFIHTFGQIIKTITD